MESISKPIDHFSELIKLSNQRVSANQDSYTQLVHIFKLEHLAKEQDPSEIIPLILDRYAYILKTHGKVDPLLVKVVEKGVHVDTTPKTILCNLCFKQATHVFNKFNLCGDHKDDIEQIHTYFKESECH